MKKQLARVQIRTMRTSRERWRCFSNFFPTSPGISGGEIIPAIPVLNLSERSFAGVLSTDGACVIDVSASPALLRIGVRLSAPDAAFNQALVMNPWLAARGMRHRSAVAFSVATPSPRVFVCSEDGRCLAVHN